VNAAPRIAVVGTGPVGRALATAYAAGGGAVAVVVSRSEARAADVARRCGAARGSGDLAAVRSADVVVLAVPDRALAETAARLRPLALPAGSLVLHTSGALAGSSVGAAASRAGSLHPLQSFPDAGDERLLAARVAGTHWFHEGEGAAEAEAMVAVWRGTMHRIAPGGKALYHAGAAVLSNHAVALFDAALSLFEAAGVPRREAHAPLAALLTGTSANVSSAGVPAALTGPIARGDVETVRGHVAALRTAAPELVESYLAMARRTLVVARAKGSLDAAAAAAIAEVLGPPRV
jgi:predicted short-subunit dehydrogenase-like oxidoreductase (DUF2520 family)